LPQEAHLEIKLYQWKSKLGDRRARESNWHWTENPDSTMHETVKCCIRKDTSFSDWQHMWWWWSHKI
jgi:hypothetical protein